MLTMNRMSFRGHTKRQRIQYKPMTIILIRLTKQLIKWWQRTILLKFSIPTWIEILWWEREMSILERQRPQTLTKSNLKHIIVSSSLEIKYIKAITGPHQPSTYLGNTLKEYHNLTNLKLQRKTSWPIYFPISRHLWEMLLQIWLIQSSLATKAPEVPRNQASIAHFKFNHWQSKQLRLILDFVSVLIKLSWSIQRKN